MRAWIREIYSSVQGEGCYVGVRQVFLRFAGCNLRCNYCDTPEARRRSGKCRIRGKAGLGAMAEINNPLDKNTVEEIIQGYGKVHSIALTGGEPLLQADFIRELRVRQPLYLESNMTLPEAAKKLRRKVSYVAGDFKLRDALGIPGDYEELREATIEGFKTLRNRRGRDCFCKVVVQQGTDVEELLENARQIKEYVSSLVLQPVSQIAGGIKLKPPRAEKLLELQQRLGEEMEVRIIPQMHRIWGVP